MGEKATDKPTTKVSFKEWTKDNNVDPDKNKEFEQYWWAEQMYSFGK
jgi:hypothetical protein